MILDDIKVHQKQKLFHEGFALDYIWPLVSMGPVLESPPEPASQNLRLLGACENAHTATRF